MDKYIYVPNSYDYNLLDSRNISLDDALNLQVKYRNDFEKILLGIIDFKSIDDYINGYGYNIPEISDNDYNFYHKFSMLGSRFIFLRNNIHIENLSDEELNIISNSIINHTNLDATYLMNTFKKVLFEKGDKVMFGMPMKENIVSGKSLIFELAYDQKKFISPKQYKFVMETSDLIHKSLRDTIIKYLNLDVSFINYNGITNIYLNDSIDEKFK